MFETFRNLPVEVQIPKIIHFIWFGSEIPVHCDKIINQCKLLHPLWKIKVWKDEDIDKLPSFENKQIFEKASNFGM